MGGTPLRYAKAEELLRLVLHLQSSAAGLTMSEMRRLVDGAGRRTVERMLRAAERLFPGLEEVPTAERVKRWRIPVNGTPTLATVTADELVALETAVGLLRRERMPGQASHLERLAASVRASLRPDARRRLEPDVEALCEAEGFAFRPGPRPHVNPEVVEALRHAIKASRQVRITYLGRASRQESRQTVCPYGFLFGNRHYLVAYNLNQRSRGYRNFALSNIGKVEIMARSFTRDPQFSLRTYAQRSFGVFQEEPFDVVWKFSADVADDVREHMFHPTQTVEEKPDGSVIVRFRAGGAQEMCWHLFTWGPYAEVIAPKHLIQTIEDSCRHWLPRVPRNPTPRSPESQGVLRRKEPNGG